MAALRADAGDSQGAIDSLTNQVTANTAALAGATPTAGTPAPAPAPATNPADTATTA